MLVLFTPIARAVLSTLGRIAALAFLSWVVRRFVKRINHELSKGIIDNAVKAFAEIERRSHGDLRDFVKRHGGEMTPEIRAMFQRCIRAQHAV